MDKRELTTGEIRRLLDLSVIETEQVEQLGAAAPWYPSDARFDFMAGVSAGSKASMPGVGLRGTRRSYGKDGVVKIVETTWTYRNGETGDVLESLILTEDETADLAEFAAEITAIRELDSKREAWINCWCETSELHQVAEKCTTVRNTQVAELAALVLSLSESVLDAEDDNTIFDLKHALERALQSRNWTL